MDPPGEENAGTPSQRAPSPSGAPPPSKRPRPAPARADGTTSQSSTPVTSAATSRAQTPGFMNPWGLGVDPLAGAISAMSKGGLAVRGTGLTPAQRGHGTPGSGAATPGGGFGRLATAGAARASGAGQAVPRGPPDGGRSEQGGTGTGKQMSRLHHGRGAYVDARRSGLSAKAIGDQFAGLRGQIDTIKDRVSALKSTQVSDMKTLTERVDGAVTELQEVSGAVEVYYNRMQVVEGALHVALERLAAAEENIRQLMAGGGPQPGAPAAAALEPAAALPVVKKNALQVSEDIAHLSERSTHLDSRCNRPQ